MPIEFPLNSVFEQTFEGHPLSDAAWLYYVTGGNRDQMNYFVQDSHGENLVGGQIFEKNTYESIPQLVNMFEKIVNDFFLIDKKNLSALIDYLFSVCVWLSNVEKGPLHNVDVAIQKRFPCFCEPNGKEAGAWLIEIHEQIQTQFRSLTEARNKTEFDDILDAHAFWQEVLKSDAYNFREEKYEPNTVFNLIGFEALGSDKGQGYYHKALIPLLWDKISEVVTFCYKNNAWPQLLQEFDTEFDQNFHLDIAYFLKLDTKPNERLGMQEVVLAKTAIYEQWDYLQKIKRENREMMQSLLTLFALSGHDFAGSMGPVLMQYQQARKTSVHDASLYEILKDIPDRIFTRKQFDEDAKMYHPNLEFILKTMSQETSEPMFMQWKAAEGGELPSQEFLSGLPAPPEKKVEVTLEPGLFIFIGAILAALFAFR